MQRRTRWRYKHAAAAEAHHKETRADTFRKKPFPEKTPKGLRPVLVLMDVKRYEEAKEAVADFLEKSPKHGAGHAMLIRIHGKLGEVGLAEHLFNYAMRAGMGCRDLYCAMVDAYANCKEFPKALRMIAAARENGMDDIRNYLNFMAGLYSDGRYVDMEQFYMSIPPEYRAKSGIIIRYADALRKMRRHDEAIEIATLSLGMRGTLGDKTMAKIIISYSEMERGNPGKAYDMLHGIYERLSKREDLGVQFRFFPRLMCGMVFACSRAGIPQPDSMIEDWRRQLEAIRNENRGKAEDVRDALICLGRIPAPLA